MRKGLTQEVSVRLTADSVLIKRQALLSSVITLFSALIYFAAEFPFPGKIAAIAIAAAACYFAYYLFFDWISRVYYREAGALLSVIGVVSLSLVINYSGGIVSPFIFFYFCILISEALYGMQNRFTLPVALLGYLFVVFGQFSGLLPYTNVWAADVYHSPIATLLISGSTSAYLILTRHITGLLVHNLRDKVEEEQREKTALMKKFSELDSSAQIGALAHRIAHDLRAPISSISGYIQMEMLRDVNDVVDAMVESLRNITRFGKTAQEQSETLELSDMMRALLAVIGYSPQALGVKFRRLFPDKSGLCVNASRADLQQAFFNIFRNALEAVHDNAGERMISVDIRRDGDEVEISVLDNGPGMQSEVLKNLFRKSMTTKADGTGVGLLITRDILMRNGGDVQIFNLPEGGLKVCVRLPLV